MNKIDLKSLKKFKSGVILHASDLNSIYDILHQIAQQANINLGSRSPWISGAVLTAGSLNNLLQDVERVFDELGFEKIKWSFGKFKDGTVLKADQLNEVVEKIQQCVRKINGFKADPN